jgi:IS5 family transposase
VSWSRFCRVRLGGSVPDCSTLKKTAKRCRPGAIEALDTALLEKAAANKVLKINRLRADTTVMLPS